MSTVITVKTYTQATGGKPSALTETSSFTTESLREALFSYFTKIDEVSLRVFMSELNRYGVAYLINNDVLIQISYIGAFPEVDW